MAEYTRPLDVIYEPKLNEPNSLNNPTISQELVFQFLDKNFEYHNNGGKVEITPDLQQKFDQVFPGLNIKDKYRPDNIGWYHKKIAEKVKKQEEEFSDKLSLTYDSSVDNSHILKARQQRAAHMMNLVNNLLLEKGLAPEDAQKLSFDTVTKALDKNPNLVLNNELDAKRDDNIVEGLKPGLEKLAPKPEPKNPFEGKTELTEESAKELQHYMSKKMGRELENYNRSATLETALHSEAQYKELAHTEGADKDTHISVQTKQNIQALRKEFNADKKPEKKKNLPTPFDDLFDPFATRK